MSNVRKMDKKKTEKHDSTFDGELIIKFKRIFYDNINVNAEDVVSESVKIVEV